MTPIPSSPSLKYLHPWDLTHVPPLNPFNDIYNLMYAFIAQNYFKQTYSKKKSYPPLLKHTKVANFVCQQRGTFDIYICWNVRSNFIYQSNGDHMSKHDNYFHWISACHAHINTFIGWIWTIFTDMIWTDPSSDKENEVLMIKVPGVLIFGGGRGVPVPKHLWLK